ncbi:MAG: SRPBCC family protein [Planctomycetes bacterium]|nr:SRPBCC family protein [Planctomycetota bacterium]
MELDPALRRRLEAGEVVVSHVSVDAHQRAQAIALIEAPVAHAWRVITDYDHYKDFMPYTRESEVLERKRNVVRFRTVLEFPLRDIWYTIRLRLDAKAHHADWTLVHGSIKANEGSWDLKRYAAARTLARYTIAFDPGFYVPKGLLRKATEGSLPRLLDAVRKRVAAPP